MLKVYLATALLMLVVLSGCEGFGGIREDLTQSSEQLRDDFDNARTEVTRGLDNIKDAVDDTKEFYGDLQNAAKEIEEAREAVEAIGDKEDEEPAETE